MPRWRITIEYTQIKACGHNESVFTQMHCMWKSYCSSGYLLLSYQHYYFLSRKLNMGYSTVRAQTGRKKVVTQNDI